MNTATGDLLNVSATGALVRVLRELPVGAQGPVVLDVDARQIELTGRVVRCERMTIELPGGAVLKQPAYAVGVMFTSVSAAAMQGVAQLCGGALSIEELPFRVLVVSADAKLNATVSEALSGAGYQIRLVTDAKATIRAAKESGADLAVVDLRERSKPSMWWVLELIESDPVTAGIPLVALADPASLNAELQRHLADRHVRVLPQPFVPADLLSLLAHALHAQH